MRYLLVILLGAAGCGILDPGEQRPGIIEHYGEVTEFSFPAVVQAGEDFEVSFYTFAGGCISKSHTGVTVVGATAWVQPIDHHSGADVCTTELRYLEHSTNVRFDAPGAATIVVRGLAEPGAREVERTLSVTVQ